MEPEFAVFQPYLFSIHHIRFFTKKIRFTLSRKSIEIVNNYFLYIIEDIYFFGVGHPASFIYQFTHFLNHDFPD